ncbi:phosphoglycerate kinase, partial [candidate division KSB3 bacterium]
MKAINDLDVRGRRVLLRADFNVPMDSERNITDDIRIRMVLPTIRLLLEKGAKLVICSHCGRPKGERNPDFSLAPVAAQLEKLVGIKVLLAPDCVGEETAAFIDAAGNNIVLLENLRFHKGETENDPAFSKALASLAEVYVNDAFAVSHRSHASVVGVAELMQQKAAGLLLQLELDYFTKSMDTPVRPLAAVVGGAKVSSKLGALTNMLDKVDKMIIGGAMANTFLKSLGVSVGASRVED